MLLAARFSFVVYLFSRFVLSACSSTGNIWRMAWGHGECGWCDNGKYTITSTVVATCYPLPPSPPHTHPSACLPLSIYVYLCIYVSACVCTTPRAIFWWLFLQVDHQPEDENNMAAYGFFIAFIVVGSFFVLNLFIGVIIDNFNTLKKKVSRENIAILNKE